MLLIIRHRQQGIPPDKTMWSSQYLSEPGWQHTITTHSTIGNLYKLLATRNIILVQVGSERDY